jgi:hypothetical protein
VLHALCALAVTRQPATQIHLFIPMALDAKLHEKVPAPDSIHIFYFTVAFFTFNLFFNVTLVVKNHMLGEIICLFPRCRGPRVEIPVLF